MKNDSESLDKLYKSHLEIEKLSASRSLCIFGALLYLVFGVVDMFSLSVTLTEVLIIRGSVVVTMLLAVVASYSKAFLKFYDVTLAAVYIIASLGIEAMIYLSLPSDHASTAYFAGLLLVIMTVFSWAYFRLVTSLLIISVVIGTYAFLEIGRGMVLSSLFVNIFFLLSAASIGFISKIIRDKHVKENFLLQQSLKEAVEAKTIEAKDNAYLANHDPLTDLPNRRYVTELLENSLEVAKQEGKILAILFLDLNGFKQVNDVYGHNVGDEVLKIVAKRLEFAVREGDSISRLAGDEFLVGLLMEEEGFSEVNIMSAKFTAMISKPMNIDGMSIKIGVSIGIAAYPMHGNKINVLINIADKKMYKTKKGVQNVVSDRQQAESEPVVIFPGNSRR